MISLKILRKSLGFPANSFTFVSRCRNPTKGIIINQPRGDDVYHGVPKDYTGAVRESKQSVSDTLFFLVIDGNTSEFHQYTARQ